MTSRAKIRPAIGAWNAADIAAAGLHLDIGKGAVVHFGLPHSHGRVGGLVGVLTADPVGQLNPAGYPTLALCAGCLLTGGALATTLLGDGLAEALEPAPR